MAVRDFKKFFKRRGRFVRQPRNDKKMFQRSRDDKNGKSDRKCFRCGDPNHLIGECSKPVKDKNQRDFASNEICLRVDLEPDKWIKDSGCSKHMMGNRKLFSITRHTMENRKAYIILNKHTRKVKESLNVTFDETPPPFKTSPLVDDDLDEDEAIKITEKKNLENDIMNETLEIDEIVSIKESRNHPLENVIGNLNQRTLRSQAQNQSNFFCFISTIEPKNINKALGDKSWIVAMQEELNQFIANDIWELVPLPMNMTIIGTKWVFRNKLDENGVVSQIRLERKPRRDHGTTRGRHSTSSSTFNQPSSSHLNDDDDDGNNEGTSRASTPSPIRPLNAQPLQSIPSLDITLSLSAITPLDHIHDTPSPPSLPQP
nr:retrovirus-related Pol polyprotein from transposon TNT 1-94 [Tanacetum cinerariifolium]